MGPDKNGSSTRKIGIAPEDVRPKFLKSRVTTIVTILRLSWMLYFRLQPQAAVSIWMESSAVQSSIIRPTDTLQHANEGYSIQQLSPPFQFQDAYRGSLFHTHPLMFLVLQPFLDTKNTNSNQGQQTRAIIFDLILLIVDVLIAIALERIGWNVLLKAENAQTTEEDLQRKMPSSIYPSHANIFGIYFSSSSKRKQADKLKEDKHENEEPIVAMKDAPSLAAHLYYASPFSAMASGVFHSSQNIWFLLLLWAVCEASRKKCSISMSAFWLALAACGDLYSVVFLIPLGLWISRTDTNETSSSRVIQLVGLFCLWFSCLYGLASLLVGGSWRSVMDATYIHAFSWKDITPNLGMQWYLSMQMFDRFTDYFVILINGLIVLMVIPLGLRLYRHPMALVAAFWTSCTLVRTIPTLHDLNLSVCLMILSTRTLSRMGLVSLIAVCGIFVPVSLFVLDYWLWLETESGNANYMFFQCLAYNIFVAMLFLDFCGATAKRGKALRLTQQNIDRGES